MTARDMMSEKNVQVDEKSCLFDKQHYFSVNGVH